MFLLRKAWPLSLCLLFSSLLFSQKGIHQQELEFYNAQGNSTADYYEANSPSIDVLPQSKSNCDLNKIVYGWHPYWGGTTYLNYNWDLLSHMSFFSYEVDPADGNAITTHGWATSAAVDAALASGNTKVTLCVALFSNHVTFFSSATSQQTLIDNLINLVQTRGAHGVNIDFEGIPSSQKTNFANFMVDLAQQMHAAIPGSEVSTVLYAVDWNDVFDIQTMEPHVDNYIIMGYDYYWSGSANSGPNDPLYHYGTNYNYTLSQSVTYYRDLGVPDNKLVLGLPYYGREWSTQDLTYPSTTLAAGSSRTIKTVLNNTSGDYNFTNYLYDSNSETDIYAFNDGANNKQCFIALEDAFEKRLDHVLKTGIAGIGIWALGYDDGYTSFWNLIENKLTNCYTQACNGQIFDFGGPNTNYYNNEDYTFTIAPPNATSISVDFSHFDLEANYDFLYIYDGSDNTSPQVAGSPFTGTNTPGQFTSTTGSLTFRMVSDGATVSSGFNATYSCNTTVSNDPSASFTTIGDTICLGAGVEVSSTSQNAESYIWTSDGGYFESYQDSTTHFYPDTSGIYMLTLTVQNQFGSDQTSDSLSVVLLDAPISEAVPSEFNLTFPNTTVYFANTSQNATEYFWDFGNGQTSIDSNPWIEYLNNGVYEVMLVASNPSLLCVSDTSFYTITVGTAGLLENGCQFEVFPNPAIDVLNIKTSNKVSEFEVLDLSGRILIQKKVNTENVLISVNLSSLSAGNYLLRLNILGEKRLIKFLKK